jgi:hypothetical protein
MRLLLLAMAAHIGMDLDQLKRTGKPWPEVCKIVWSKFFRTANTDTAAAIVTEALAELPPD